jgi:hypothetical protein
MALSLSDLPGAGWRQVGEKSWRIGSTFPRDRDEATRRAHQAGLYTAARFFMKNEIELGFSAQVSAYASSEDAASRVSALPALTLNNHGRTLMSERTFEDRMIPGVSRSKVFEQFSSDREGSGFGQYAGGCQGNILFIVSCTTIQYGRRDEPEERWSWSELVALAQLQADKVRRLQNEPTS